MIKSISATEFSKLLASGKSVDLIDVRTPAEFRAMHVAIARNEPLDRLDPKAIQQSRNGSSNEPLYVVCRSGGRSRQACERFLAAGVTNVVNVEGGTMACAAANAPVVRGKKSIPLNCQVQIITGLTVVAGALLTVLTSNLAWLALPIVMGAGLIFSGLTDTCAMGAVLAKFPWNQIKNDVGSSSTTLSPKPCKETGTNCCG